MALRKLTPEEEEKISSGIKDGSVSQVHLGTYQSVFRPRGAMMKNSLGQYMLEKLNSTFESWTDPKYGDNPHTAELLKTMHKNMMEEVELAWGEFLTSNFLNKVL